MKRKMPKLQIDKEELIMAKLAGEFKTTMQVHIEPTKNLPGSKKDAKLTRQLKRIQNKRRVIEVNPYDALTRFKVTVSCQVLDIKLKTIGKQLLASQIDGLVEEARNQMVWAVQNRLQELKMKFDYEKPFTIPYKESA